MNITLLHRAGRETLILFFNGWSRDASGVAALAADGFDVAEASDYTTLDSDLPSLAASYPKRILIAWSLGVWAAAKVFGGSGIEFEDAVAINGTPRPVSAEFGIAPEIFEGTAAHWHEERARERFLLRMAGDRAGLARLPEARRTPESQQSELAAIARQVAASPETASASPFHRAVIGTADRIFPAAAQRAFWRAAEVEAAERDLPHYPFFGISGWREVTDLGKNR